MVKKSDVINAYRWILGRDPESKKVIELYKKTKDVDELRNIFLQSDEFSRLAESIIMERVGRYDFCCVDERVDVVIDDKKMEMLLKLVVEEWEELGKENPYWSVLTNEKYKISNITDLELQEFYISGRGDVDYMKKVVGKYVDLNKIKNVFELGCGVGRCTIHLCSDFDFVYAVDISSGNLDICKSYLDNNGVNNVQYCLARSIKFEEFRQKYDLFYSVITLQHNPPPVQYVILKNILNNLRVGGVAFFQLWAHGLGYKFNIEDYLSSYKRRMQMHSLPLSYVFDVAHQVGAKVLDVFPDNKTGMFGSYTIVLEKDGMKGV